MTVPVKLAAFAAVLAVAAGIAFGVGALSGAEGETVADRSDSPGHEGHADDPGDGHEDHMPAVDALPGGLQVADRGYALEVLGHPATTGLNEPFEFRIIGPDGSPVTDFDEVHEAELHLIVVRRDLTAYRHVHPDLGDDGTWTIPLEFDTAGTYRAFADFKPSELDDALTLGVDIDVEGTFTPQPVATPARVVEVGEYTITLDGDLHAGQASLLTLTVSRDGRPVTDLQPYLGAAGHLVALRRGDLAYVHVHPDEADDSGPDVGFEVAAPSAGTYQLYFEFQHGGTVRTAEFTVETSHDH